MKRIIQANIDRFKRLLASETDATKRVTLFRLLGEEEEKLAAADKTPDGINKAWGAVIDSK